MPTSTCAFTDNGDGHDRLTYDADAVVGGMIGGVGQRMLSRCRKRMAGEFFGDVDGVLTGAHGGGPRCRRSRAAPLGVAEAQPACSPPRPKAGRAGRSEDFVKGVVVGAALVLSGVVLGGPLGRRREPWRSPAAR